MKNLLLCGSFLLLGANALQAQVNKVPMIEHFTQASCGPCASQNPAMKVTLDAFGTANYAKISHQVSWPGFDPMYNSFPTGPDARVSYYGVTGVPNTSLNGSATGAPNTIVTAATLSAAAMVMTPYDIAVSQSWADPNTVTVTIDVANTTGAAVSSADKIYVTMVENQVNYATAPGSNGEVEFYNVMRQMYNATTGAEGATTGAALSSIAANSTQNFTFTITNLPSYIADKGQVAFVVYIQNDGSKEMMQAGKSVPVPIPGLIDVAATTASIAGAGYCDYSFTPGVEFTNNDAAAVTDVVVEYSINGGTAIQQAFSGSLAQGQSTTISFPGATLAGGTSVVSYNVVSVNGAQNWQSPSAISIADETYNKLNLAGVAAPVSEGMETAVLNGGYSTELTTAIFDGGGIGAGSFGVLDGPTFNYGAIGGFALSDRSIRFRFYNISAGDQMSLIMQKVNLTSNSQLTFSHAYRQYSSENDKLEVFVSTDCGSTWTSVFAEQGSSLATLPLSTTAYVPAAASDWAANTVDLSAYDNTSDVVIRFTATSDFGNNMFLDDINIGGATNVEDLTSTQFDVYPNPATDKVTVKVSEAGSVDARIDVLDLKGQVVSSNVLAAGQSSVEVSTSSLASGVYTLRVMSETGVATERLVIQ